MSKTGVLCAPEESGLVHGDACLSYITSGLLKRSLEWGCLWNLQWVQIIAARLMARESNSLTSYQFTHFKGLFVTCERCYNLDPTHISTIEPVQVLRSLGQSFSEGAHLSKDVAEGLFSHSSQVWECPLTQETRRLVHSLLSFR